MPHFLCYKSNPFLGADVSAIWTFLYFFSYYSLLRGVCLASEEHTPCPASLGGPLSAILGGKVWSPVYSSPSVERQGSTMDKPPPQIQFLPIVNGLQKMALYETKAVSIHRCYFSELGVRGQGVSYGGNLILHPVITYSLAVSSPILSSSFPLNLKKREEVWG